MFEMWRIAGIDSKNHLKEFEKAVLNEGNIPLLYTTDKKLINHFKMVMGDYDVEAIAIIIMNDGKIND